MPMWSASHLYVSVLFDPFFDWGGVSILTTQHICTFLSVRNAQHCSWNGVLEVRQCVRNWGQCREGKKKKKVTENLRWQNGETQLLCWNLRDVKLLSLAHISNSAVHLLSSISIYNLCLTCLISWIFWASCYSVDLCSQKRFCEAINEIPMIFIWLPLSCIWIKLLLKIVLGFF